MWWRTPFVSTQNQPASLRTKVLAGDCGVMVRFMWLSILAGSLIACSNPTPTTESVKGLDSSSWTVDRVVDGDTIYVSNSAGVAEKVRFIGIDTPEEGKCGFSDSKAALEDLLGGHLVELSPGATTDRDRYGRLLRYVEVNGTDIGLQLIADGYAIARYDSRDGYGRHPREDQYVAADKASQGICATSP